MKCVLLAVTLLNGGDAGGFWPRVDPSSWPVWTPSDDFEAEFASWPEPQHVPQEIQVWCKAFIPSSVSNQTVGRNYVMPIVLPGGLPAPGYAGQCAVIDGRSWSSIPFTDSRPNDSRFGARLVIAAKNATRGLADVHAHSACGFSHNVCCNLNGCENGVKYGEYTCGPMHCPDNEMQIRRLQCWTRNGSWTAEGENCIGVSDIVATKVYFYGRGRDPCVHPLNVQSPAATWDIGIVVFPTKRRVLITGFVDDAPSTECYAQARDNGVWGEVMELVRLAPKPGDLALDLVGYSDRAVNPANQFVLLPEPGHSATLVV
eukprot:gnl/MRDRNA2_/MRDRNA2_185252_c0_seq1.p1 gnl/MRDRNA2_/MRDRNA2_185252_c0~~gnl/MRDRNA2_/MRDRNA2_185252_c0_seq1.p1  ORF type:complete len:316 (+),score=46.48 gnl/MRDRNA2_/MRDRNA2_185252_c0_seq1:96-1043(+)